GRRHVYGPHVRSLLRQGPGLQLPAAHHLRHVPMNLRVIAPLLLLAMAGCAQVLGIQDLQAGDGGADATAGQGADAALEADVSSAPDEGARDVSAPDGSDATAGEEDVDAAPVSADAEAGPSACSTACSTGCCNSD